MISATKIDVLILNAAIMMCPYGLTEDGLETQFGTNHIGHFLFGNLLLKDDLIGRRVVVVGSSASELPADPILTEQLADLTYGGGEKYDPALAYSFSKACNNLYAKKLARLLAPKGIAVFTLNPGSIRTNLQVHMAQDPTIRQRAIERATKLNPDFTMPVPKTLQQGCATQLRAALDPELEAESGAYLNHCQVANLKIHEGHEAYVDQVWELSEKIVGEKFHF
jgi:NAD(P)-dependent dehydrogenase (short-subunit alcohol dehydrogenase family)